MPPSKNKKIFFLTLIDIFVPIIFLYDETFEKPDVLSYHFRGSRHLSKLFQRRPIAAFCKKYFSLIELLLYNFSEILSKEDQCNCLNSCC